MARQAIVDTKNVVVNVVIWEGAEWLPPRNHYVIKSDSADIGDTYDQKSGLFTKPKPVADDAAVDLQIP